MFYNAYINFIYNDICWYVTIKQIHKLAIFVKRGFVCLNVCKGLINVLSAK